MVQNLAVLMLPRWRGLKLFEVGGPSDVPSESTIPLLITTRSEDVPNRNVSLRQPRKINLAKQVGSQPSAEINCLACLLRAKPSSTGRSIGMVEPANYT
jgi:hypothetical protein